MHRYIPSCPASCWTGNKTRMGVEYNNINTPALVLQAETEQGHSWGESWDIWELTRELNPDPGAASPFVAWIHHIRSSPGLFIELGVTEASMWAGGVQRVFPLQGSHATGIRRHTAWCREIAETQISPRHSFCRTAFLLGGVVWFVDKI